MFRSQVISVTVNKVVYNALTNQLILSALQENHINIPYFCYHKNLNIAGNCRMCLVEISGFAKLAVACATELKDGMKLFTNTKLVTLARENILEFLLCNHPLDCPICDQGGECDLQDQSYIFGRARGRFYEQKRAVSDMSVSPIVKFIMTRCIHCTRCVRFFEEFSGNYLLGLINRGNNMQVNTYLNTKLNFELSGNVIDICPVGALTSKSSEFQSRPWEMKKYQTVDFFDTTCTDLRVDVAGTKIIRFLPFTNETYLPWISDLTRGYVDIYKLNAKYLNPYYYVTTKKQYIIASLSYITTLYHKFRFGQFYEAAPKINEDAISYFAGNITKHNVILGNFLDLRSLKACKSFLKLTRLNALVDIVENHNVIDYKLKSLNLDRGPVIDSLVDYFYESTDFTNFSLNTKLLKTIGLSNNNYFSNFQTHLINGLISSILFCNINLRYEYPVLNSYITQYLNNSNQLSNKLIIGSFGVTNPWTYPVLQLGSTFAIFKKLWAGQHWFCQNFSTTFKTIKQNWSVNYFCLSLRQETSLYENYFIQKFLLDPGHQKAINLNTYNLTLVKFWSPSVTILNSYVLGLYSSYKLLNQLTISNLIYPKLDNWFSLNTVNYLVNVSVDTLHQNNQYIKRSTEYFNIYQSNYIHTFFCNLKNLPVFDLIIPTTSLLEYTTNTFSLMGTQKQMSVVLQTYKYSVSHYQAFTYMALKLWLYLYLRNHYNLIPATKPVSYYYFYMYHAYKREDHNPDKFMIKPLKKFKFNFLYLLSGYLSLYKHGERCYPYFINLGMFPAKCLNHSYGFPTKSTFNFFSVKFLNIVLYKPSCFYNYSYLDSPEVPTSFKSNMIYYVTSNLFVIATSIRNFYTNNFVTAQSKTLQLCSKYFGNISIF